MTRPGSDAHVDYVHEDLVQPLTCAKTGAFLKRSHPCAFKFHFLFRPNMICLDGRALNIKKSTQIRAQTSLQIESNKQENNSRTGTRGMN